MQIVCWVNKQQHSMPQHLNYGMNWNSGNLLYESFMNRMNAFPPIFTSV